MCNLKNSMGPFFSYLVSTFLVVQILSSSVSAKEHIPPKDDYWEHKKNLTETFKDFVRGYDQVPEVKNDKLGPEGEHIPQASLQPPVDSKTPPRIKGELAEVKEAKTLKKQSMEQVLKEEFPENIIQSEQTHPVPEPGPGFYLKQGEDIPDKKSDPSFFLKQIEIDGNTIFSDKTIKKAVPFYRDQMVTIAQLNKIAEQVTSFYNKKGFTHAEVHLSDQKGADGNIKLVVEEGKRVSLPTKDYSAPTNDVIHVKKFRIAGNKAIPSKTIFSIIRKYNNKDYTFEQLKSVADTITLLYQENNYMFARAYIMKKKIVDGVVSIGIVEGNLGTVDVLTGPDYKYYTKWYINRFFKSLKGKAVREGEMERTILLINDTPSLNVTTVFNKGIEAGTVDLKIKVEDKYPIKLSIEYDNHGHPLTSKNRFRANFEVTDPLFGSTLSLTGLMGESITDIFYGGAEFQIPIDSNGTRAGGRFIIANYIVGGELADLGITGESQIYGGYFSHPILRARDSNLKATLGIDFKRMSEFVLNSQISNDNLSIVYLKAEYDSRDRFLGKNYLSVNYSHGFNDFLGSLKKEDPVASRSGASGGFDKVNLDYIRVQKIWREIILMTRLSGQYSFALLVSPEQFSIGGATTVRGHQVSRFLGDHGYVLSTELTAPNPFMGDMKIVDQRISDLIRFAIFTDQGGVFKREVLPGESSFSKLSSIGAGLRINLLNRINLKLDAAFPITLICSDQEAQSSNVIYYAMLKVNLLEL